MTFDFAHSHFDRAVDEFENLFLKYLIIFRVTPRGGMKISDGSLSDTQTYSEVKSDYGIPYAPWLRHRYIHNIYYCIFECECLGLLYNQVNIVIIRLFYVS